MEEVVKKIGRKWLVCKTRKVQVKSEGSRIFRSSDWTGRNQDGKEEDKRSISGAVYTRVEVRRMDSEMSGLVERPWLQLMCCTICLLHGHNFRWRRESPSGSEYWLVCCCWTPEIEFNKRLSSSIIRLVNYSVTTSLIYNWYYRRCLGFQW